METRHQFSVFTRSYIESPLLAVLHEALIALYLTCSIDFETATVDPLFTEFVLVVLLVEPVILSD